MYDLLFSRAIMSWVNSDVSRIPLLLVECR